jgi:hypothetical protein
MSATRNANTILAGNSEGERHLRRLWRRWEDNIKIVLKGRGCEGVE